MSKDSNNDNSTEMPCCMICYSDLEHPCLTPCGHNEICGKCHLRLRHLHSDKKCPMCKQENQQVIVDYQEEAKEEFEQYPLWGNELGTEFFFREDVGMFFPTPYYESEIVPLFGYHCGVCKEYDGVNCNDNADDNNNDAEAGGGRNKNRSKKKKKKTPIKGLQEHLRTKHRLALCQLCVEFKRNFVALLPRLYPTQLKTHLTKGDGPDSGFNGHPLCEFCRPKRFYDLTQLHMHLQKEHYKCHVCDKQGLANQYFRDYNGLEKHFDRMHFMCQDPQCLAARFVVFENEIDLRAHQLSCHGSPNNGGSTKIQLEFRIRREGYAGEGYDSNQTAPSEDDFQYGLDGQAFVPQALPAAAPNRDTSDPVHYQRTEEMRAHAAVIRAAVAEENKEEAFPTLASGDNNTGNALLLGWTSNNSRLAMNKKKKTRAEEFPSLPTARQKKLTDKKLRATPNRQFAAMQSAAVAAASPATADWNARQGVSAATTGRVRMNSFNNTSSAIQANRQTNLASNNFPSLGGGTSKRITAATFGNNKSRKVNISSQNFPSLGGTSNNNKSKSVYNSVVKHKPPPPPVNNFAYLNMNSNGVNNNTPQVASRPNNNRKADNTAKKKPPPSNNVNNFPSLMNNNVNNNAYTTIKNKSQQQKKKTAPPMTNTQHFPPPPKANNNKNNTIRDKLLKEDNKVIPRASLQQGMATVDDIKTSLGQTKYKELKNLTKLFAADGLEPYEYVERAAFLFDGGDNEDFWGFVPGLLMSCPNENSADIALQYMEELRAAQMSSSFMMTSSSSTPAVAATTRGQRQQKSSGNNVQNGTTWNSSVSSKQQQQQSKNDNKKKKKKNNKNELRALAFGA